MVMVARVGDKTKGHSDHGPLTITTGSPKVMIGGVQVAVVGSKTTPGHGTEQTITTGSSKVKIGGVPVAIVGSEVSCGDEVATGSSKFNIGG